MWYSEDGAKRKRFRSRGRDARGREVVHEVPLRIGDNWHLVFALTRPGASEEAARETHHLTVFQHMVDKVRGGGGGGGVLHSLSCGGVVWWCRCVMCDV
jgi:hypothetical protein